MERTVGIFRFTMYIVGEILFSIYFRQEQNRILPEQPTNTEAVRLSVIGNFIPSVSYNFKF